METTGEAQRNQFSQRLLSECERIGLPVSSPTLVAREFNRHYSGHPVTPQTVRKWLLSVAIPTQPKLLALASMLGVSAQWLRFGTGEKLEPLSDSNSDRSALLVLEKNQTRLIPIVKQLTQLSPKEIRIVESLVSAMLEEKQP